MNDKIKELLRKKFGDLNSDQLEHIAKGVQKKATTEEEATKAIEELALSDILQSYADMRVTKALAQKPKDTQDKDTAKQEPKEEPDAQGQSTPEWVKTILESNKALTDRLSKLEGDKVKAQRSTRLEECIRDLPETLQKVYKRMDIESLDDDAFSDLLKEVAEEAKTTMDDLRKSGATFKVPRSKGIDGTDNGEPKEDSKEEIEAILEALQ